MSSPLDRTVGPDEPSPYAPKWIRDACGAKRKRISAGFENLQDDERSRSGTPSTVPDGGVVIEHFRLPPSLEPTMLPPPGRESRSLTGVLGSLALAVAVAAVVAFVIVGKPWTSGVTKSAEATKSVDDPNSFLPRFAGQTPASAPPAPKLVAGQAVPRRTGEVFPLGVSIRGPSEGAMLLIGGLANGATLSAGHPAGDNSWRVPVADLDSVMIQPPRDFVGAMDLTIELRLADDTLTDRRSLRFEWAGPAIPEVSTEAYAIHQLDPDEITVLLKRGDELLVSGDLAAARLVLQRAAEAGDARGALALAGTYDPMVLEKLPIHGLVPNIAMARRWYEKARQFGSADAPRRLEMLASRRE